MQTSMQGQRVLVTAGAAGIGRVIAQDVSRARRACACVRRRHGRARSPRARNARHRPTLADVSRVADVERLFGDVARELGGLDVLVNNAGVAGPTAKVEDIRPEDWERCIAVDLNGMFYCTRRAMPMLKAAGGGSIINLSSIAGRLGFALRTPYAAAKWAVVGFSESLAAEAGPDGVRVNCIQPGVVEGERVERVIEAKAKGLGISNDEMRRRLLESVSLRTMVSAQDVANTALFLASEAGRHISGQSISVCGGVRYMV